jgi:hypothetical protein
MSPFYDKVVITFFSGTTEVVPDIFFNYSTIQNLKTMFTKIKLFTIITCSFLAFTTLNAQNIITVDNSTAIADADYTSIDSAIANANTDDIIMVYGSPISYGTVTVNKRVKIIGVGYFLTENPNTQTTGSAAIIQEIYFQSGASGTSLVGMYLNFRTHIQEDNIFLQRCKLNEVRIYNRNGVIIDQCFSNSYIVNMAGGNTTGLIVSNSVFSYIFTASTSEVIAGGFTNNIFTGYANVNQLPENSTYKNNIFTPTQSSVYIINPVGGNVFFNNIWIQSASAFNINGNSGSNTGNIFGASSTTLFEGAAGNSTDGQYQLKATSPALGAGQNGIDCGIFGGTTPYILSGIPPIPTIYQLNAATSATTSGGLQVEIKVKSN